MNNAITIAVETPLQAEVAALLQQADTVAARLYPGADRRSMTPDDLVETGTHTLVARIAGVAVGLCILLEREAGTVELKRMIVDAGARRRGVGAALIQELLLRARQMGAGVILLEVGLRNVQAQELYRRTGFAPRTPFPPHRASPLSLFLERRV